MARLLAGEIKSFNMEKRYFHANGSIVPVNLTVVPMWDEEESYKCHIAMVEDITNRKRVEESLHTTVQRFYTILSGMYPSILLVTERTGSSLPIRHSATISIWRNHLETWQVSLHPK